MIPQASPCTHQRMTHYLLAFMVPGLLLTPSLPAAVQPSWMQITVLLTLHPNCALLPQLLCSMGLLTCLMAAMVQTLTCFIADALALQISLCQMFLLSKGPPQFATLKPEGLSLEICLPVLTMLRQACRPARPCLLASSPPPILPWMEAFWQFARPLAFLLWMVAERQYARPPLILP